MVVQSAMRVEHELPDVTVRAGRADDLPGAKGLVRVAFASYAAVAPAAV